MEKIFIWIVFMAFLVIAFNHLLETAVILTVSFIMWRLHKLGFIA